MPVTASDRTVFSPTTIHCAILGQSIIHYKVQGGRPNVAPTQKKDEALHLVLDLLYYFLASRAEIDSIIFDIFSSAFASFAFSASISCAGAFARNP